MTLTPARLENLLIYALVCVANMLAIAVCAALAADSMPGFRDGEFLHPAQPEAVALLAILTPVLSGWIAANRPSFGGEGLAAQASVLRSQGYHRDDMRVLSPDHAAVAIAGDGSIQGAFTPAQEKQITDALERRMKAEPAHPDPDPLPPSPRYPTRGRE